ncbi:TPA: hypothetical protein ACP5TM_004619 [Vibrio parahaemolyticus]
MGLATKSLKKIALGGEMKPILELMIYKNIGFYERKYFNYANNSKIEIIDDRKIDGRVVDVFRFELMPGSKDLSMEEKFPALHFT